MPSKITVITYANAFPPNGAAVFASVVTYFIAVPITALCSSMKATVTIPTSSLRNGRIPLPLWNAMESMARAPTCRIFQGFFRVYECIQQCKTLEVLSIVVAVVAIVLDFSHSLVVAVKTGLNCGNHNREAHNL